MKKVCVIGAGTAGLCAAKHSITAGLSVTIFEQANSVGGTWVYTENIGHDEFGLPVHTSMYKDLRTNLPKEVMGFPDFPIPEQELSYIKRECMLNFLNLYAENFGLKERIKFQHHVIRVKPFNESQWEVSKSVLAHLSFVTSYLSLKIAQNCCVVVDYTPITEVIFLIAQ